MYEITYTINQDIIQLQLNNVKHAVTCQEFQCCATASGPSQAAKKVAPSPRQTQPTQPNKKKQPEAEAHHGTSRHINRHHQTATEINSTKFSYPT